MDPHRFNAVAWEIRALFQRDGATGSSPEEDSARVEEFFGGVRQANALKLQLAARGSSADGEAELDRMEKQRAGQQLTVEAIIGRQIKETLAAQGIFNPWYQYARLKATFPAPFFKLERPPYILIVSPRDRIETTRTVLLNQELTSQDRGKIEAEVEKLGVSSLVDDLGGLGSTYPALVASNTSLGFTLDTAVHEWVHQYLFFTPLGFRYALDRLGIARSRDIFTMNETVANMVGKEISALMRQKYYPGYRSSAPTKPKISFSKEMRDIRRQVDQFLAQGEIDRAEQFMEEKRQYLAANGYVIRRLNQAYFAFHGGYADDPAFVNAIGEQLKKLRSRKASVSQFLHAVAGMTGAQDLRLAAGDSAQ